jgi:hypothetical protein
MKFSLALTASLLALGLPIFGQQTPDNPFGKLSERAGTVLMVAIGEAQQRGASDVDVNDLVFALVLEDQEPDAFGLFQETPPGVLFPPGLATGLRAHEPFLTPKVAIDVLVKLNEILPRSNSIPPGTEMQTSAAYGRVISAAKNLPSQFHQSEVRIDIGDRDNPPGMYQAVVPLDLLAAALREPCEATKMLQEAGITEEKVLQVLRSGGDLENGSFHLEPSTAPPQPDAQTPRK